MDPAKRQFDDFRENVQAQVPGAAKLAAVRMNQAE